MTTESTDKHQLPAIESVNALLSGIIDYAGLFPPANLDMATTVHNYADYFNGNSAWMLGRLIVPTSRLDEFEQCAEMLFPHDASDDAWRLSALTAPAGHEDFQKHLQRIDEFNRKHDQPKNGLASIDLIESKATRIDDVEQALDQVDDELFPFFEVAADDDPRGLISALAGLDAGAKVRTGGVTKDAYPTSKQLARFIVACTAAEVPFKATAGLHHPLRHYNADFKIDEFGFLNVFIAAVLANHYGLDELRVVELLEVQSIDSFQFDNNSISWRDLTVDVEQIDDVRTYLALSFGSCSFDDPCIDLRALKLL